jgi:hypothetical protein
LEISILEVFLLEKVSHFDMLKTFSKISLEEEIHLLILWMMMMTSSLEGDIEDHISNNLKKNVERIRSASMGSGQD